MKKLLSILIFLQFFVVLGALAQYDGRRFISGSAGVAFSNNNPDLAKVSQSYGYNVNVGIGKFKTETRASGWNLSSTLNGGTSYFTNANGEPQMNDRISGFSLGAGYFWQYYKHFNDKFGIFAGPALNGGYTLSNQITQDQGEPFDTKTNTISVAFAVNAGLYYKLSERWWLTAGLGFATPLAVSYQFGEQIRKSDGRSFDSSAFQYEFSPSFTFPSVGLGLRYFLAN
ncbi:hypothetical protein [Dyadobacter sp. CY326]|uniref:hypothetical protein n=1 Tax=Dyadobacter sp. CY326 TaxID=2907300 RepID=UPI001F45F788|nr:hypothetical protein [Dyadobacter sp. CY326]MCE7065672.1 hypothetical protein [Dyadobacter sp. CY326]